MTISPWTDQENADLVSLYFDMLDRTVAGELLNKAKLIRSHQCIDGCHQPLSSRSKGSIEFKLMNATAAHVSLLNDHIERFGEPDHRDTMHSHGYRALANYQKGLKDAMLNELLFRAKTVV